MKKHKRVNAVKKKKIYNKDIWCAALDAVCINDSHWCCMVTIMMEVIVQHSWYTWLFHDSVEQAEQAYIYSLSYQKAIDTVRTLSKQDPEKCPAIDGICYYASTLLNENNGHLSTWLVARIIKYLIYRTRIEHIKRFDENAVHGTEDQAARNIDSASK